MCEPRQSGFYSEYGTFMHEIMEKYFKGELAVYELLRYYEENYESVVLSSPPSTPKINPDELWEKYYQDGYEFLENFEFDEDRYEVIGVEDELRFKVGKYDFVGKLDLVLRDKETGYILIEDYKSSDPYKTRKSPDKKKIEEYERQMYLYAHGYRELHGVLPHSVFLWFFRIGKKHQIVFDEVRLQQILREVELDIDKIMLEDEYRATPNWFFCNFLCNHKDTCERKD